MSISFRHIGPILQHQLSRRTYEKRCPEALLSTPICTATEPSSTLPFRRLRATSHSMMSSFWDTTSSSAEPQKVGIRRSPRRLPLFRVPTVQPVRLLGSKGLKASSQPKNILRTTLYFTRIAGSQDGQWWSACMVHALMMVLPQANLLSESSLGPDRHTTSAASQAPPVLPSRLQRLWLLVPPCVIFAELLAQVERR